MHALVIGAGAFGGWTALHMLRAGWKVTLVDAWGAGNSRASSGGETRVIRGSYGENGVYTQMVARSLPLWRENERRWGRQLLHANGALWMAAADDAWERASVKQLRTAGLRFEELDQKELKRRFPQVNFEGLPWAIHELDAGYLLARRACQTVVRGFQAENGSYVQQSAAPGTIARRAMDGVRLADGQVLKADHYVFAAGPWLGRMFPDVIGDRIRATRQEIFFFGNPAGDKRFEPEHLPTWVDNSPVRFYGIPGNEGRGFKIAEDTPGEAFDPTNGDRQVSEKGLASIREYLGFRFPALQDAPLVESRICQYEMSEDGNLIVDRHPLCDNAWLVGGGSGHGFKLGPALGEMVARVVMGKAKGEGMFQMERLKGSGTGGRPRK
ncbi:MAG: FAD-dependent oxidoreductase [Acidimicrobiia bacterium]|nr:FAD-dependent oxidoreductase [Acidimicrobiia bacterium]